MTYAKQTWYNSPSTASPTSAERFNHMEDGIADGDVTTPGSPAAVALAAALAHIRADPSTPSAGWVLDVDVCFKVGRVVTANFIATKSSAWVTADGVLTLPSGFRPSYTVRMGGWSGIGGATSACAFTLGPDGGIIVYGAPAGNTQVGFSATYLAA